MANNIAGELSEKQTQIAHAQARAIADSASVGAIDENKFVFFAAFDGTRNDMKDVKLSGNPLDSNVAQLYKQADKVVKANPEGNLRAHYYPGHGTNGALVASDWLPAQVTQEAIDTAQKAYNQFSKQASAWLKEHPNGEITTAITSFSRGGATAAVFTHMLYKNGLIDPETEEVLIPPGQVGVSAGVIFDPVTTGVDANVAFAPNVKNVAVIRAENEYHYLFKAVDYAIQNGINIFPAIGNHCNIGGGNDNDGLGALYLEAATRYFQKSGLNIADVDPSRRLDSNASLLVFDESGTTNDMDRNPLNQEQRCGKWDVYAHFTSGAEKQPARLLDKVAQPAQVQQLTDSILTDFILYNKQHAIEIKAENQEKAKVYLEESQEEVLKNHPDLLGAYSLKTALLIAVADRPASTKEALVNYFDTVMVANIERGNLSIFKQDLDIATANDIAAMQA